jgi:hypothetical protein
MRRWKKRKRQQKGPQAEAASRPAKHPARVESPSRVLGERRGAWLGLVTLGCLVLAGVVLLPRWLERWQGSSTLSVRPVSDDVSEGARVPLLGSTWEELDDPNEDSWETEIFSAQAEKQLKALGELVIRHEEISEQRMAEFTTPEFRSGALRPAPLRTAFRDEALVVRRPTARESQGESGFSERPPAHTHQGAAGLAQALLDLSKPFQGATDARFKFKLFRVRSEQGAVITHQYFQISGRTAGRLLEENATWVVRWDSNATGSAPKFRSIEVTEFEQVESQKGEPFFTDCTASLLGHNSAYQEQFLYGFDYWLERIQDNRFFDLLGTPGLALGDANGDGLEDLYVCQEGGLPNRLFVQTPDGKLDDVSETSGVDWIESTRSALFLDLDNDGDQDLAAAILGSLLLAANDGRGRFRIRAMLPTGNDTFSLSAADYDRDADLDIYVCSYREDDLAQDFGVLSLARGSRAFVYHDANNGARNKLFRNEISQAGKWTFTDVTEDAGLEVNNRRFSFAASWEDYDNDGDMDLYVANDFGRNNLYRNDVLGDGAAGFPKKRDPMRAARFVDVAARAQVEDSASGMSVTWGDFDRDGWMDLYVSNMFSAAGNRITYQDRFKADAPEVRRRLQRFARGNTLLRNRGDGSFEDVSVAAGVTVGRWAWSSNFVDINNDGWEDLVVANGYMTTDDSGDL